MPIPTTTAPVFPDPTVPVALLRVYDATEYDTVYALVELTPAFCQQALARMSRAAQLKAEEPQFDELRWWDSTPTWFHTPPQSLRPDLADELLDQADAVNELLDTTFDGEPVIVAPGDFPAYLREALATAAQEPDDQMYARIDCCRLCVDAESLYWYCLVKNTDIVLITTLLSKELLERYAVAPTETKP